MTILILIVTTVLSIGICCFAVGAAYDEEINIRKHYADEFAAREAEGFKL